DAGGYPLGSPTTATVTIFDDPPVVAMTPVNVVEGNSGDVIFTRTGGKLGDSLTVTYTIGGSATPDDDYTPLSGVVTFDPGSPTAPVTITAKRDNVVEPDGETVTLTIVPTSTYLLAGGPQSATATNTIIDDPAIVCVDPAMQSRREGTDGNITLNRAGGDLTQPLTVHVGIGADGQADPLAIWNVDYTLGGAGVTGGSANLS